MNLKSQLEDLSKTLQGKISSLAIEKAIIPVVVAYAKRVKRGHFFIWENLDKQWVVTTLAHRSNPSLEKKVIYAFTSLQDAKKHEGYDESELQITEIPVVFLLMELFWLKEINSIIFFSYRGDFRQGIEVEREQFLDVLKSRLSQLEQTVDSSSRLA